MHSRLSHVCWLGLGSRCAQCVVCSKHIHLPTVIRLQLVMTENTYVAMKMTNPMSPSRENMNQLLQQNIFLYCTFFRDFRNIPLIVMSHFFEVFVAYPLSQFIFGNPEVILLALYPLIVEIRCPPQGFGIIGGAVVKHTRFLR